ncbi:putative glycoside hydrolase [Cohnella sp. WQ 127256]|uniref:putative glycoside hydrolase n=1 Tax=Cohnella sp. WQ 127256 TaxID=2938790 RepID=UPI00211919FC
MRNKLARFIVLFLVLEYLLLGCASRQSGPQSQPQRKNENSVQEISHQNSQDKLVNTKSDVQNTSLDERPVSLVTSTRPVRAIYVTSHVANSGRMTGLIDLVKETELNAMVLDVNSGITLFEPVQTGNMADYSQLTLSNKRSAQHFLEVINKLKQQDIYLIGRIVTFKNPAATNAMPAWAIKRKDGKIWKDRSGTAWIDPYRQEAWAHPLALAENAALIGFDEVQFDYVRFPENASKVNREVKFANSEGWTKSEAIRRFLHRANIKLHKYGTKVSADVFGMTGSSNDDMGIGQKWDAIVKEVDVISPMIYPSHYSKGMWGVDNPDLSPGPIIKRALEDTVKHNRKLNEQGIATAKVRPWIQGFTAGWIHPHQKYGQAQINEQIRAARKAGFNSYMIWNSANRYPNIAP